MKTKELEGGLLDYWVAKAEGIELMPKMPPRIAGCWNRHECDYEEFSPSTNWSQGGPIIEREGISIHRNDSGTWNAAIPATKANWYEFLANFQYSAPSPLIAAMRCRIASKFGDEVTDINLDSGPASKTAK